VALDPGDALAVNSLGIYERVHNRLPAARALVARAVRAHPSSADLRALLALVAYEAGDTVVAWPAAVEALRLAPRSLRVTDAAFRVALALRRYGEAGELVARRRALDPASSRGDLAAARLAWAVGDSVAVGRALRAYQAKGGRITAAGTGVPGLIDPLFLMGVADAATGDALLAGTPATFGAASSIDSVSVYYAQAQLLLARGEVARARPLQARGFTLLRRVVDAAPPPGKPQASFAPDLSWFAAAQGDRATADRTLAAFATAFAADLRDVPDGPPMAGLTCARAEVAGLLGDVAALLAPLRRCLTMPNGYPVATLRTLPAFARHAADPRVRALAAAELAAAEQRARATPVQPAR
jgi:hypothetical protein